MSRYSTLNRTKSLILAVLMLGSVGVASAFDHDEMDAKTIAAAKVDMASAITTAENSAGGKASRAELEDRKGALTYEVEVVSHKKVTDVKIDAMTGAIISSKEDKAD